MLNRSYVYTDSLLLLLFRIAFLTIHPFMTLRQSLQYINRRTRHTIRALQISRYQSPLAKI